MQNGKHGRYIVSGKEMSLLPDSICITGTNILFSPLVRSLGVAPDHTLASKPHISNSGKTLSRTEKDRFCPPLSLLMRRKRLCVILLFCRSSSCLSAVSPKCSLGKLQKLQNYTARIVVRSSKHEPVSPLKHTLRWLPICQRLNQLQTFLHLFLFCYWHRPPIPC